VERFFRPATLGDALALFERYPEAIPIAGGTDLIVYANQRYQRFPALVSMEGLRELQELTLGENEIVLGAGLTLGRIEHSADVAAAAPLLAELWPLFSSRLIRNRATLGGNLGTASPIGDSAPGLLALGAKIELVSAKGTRVLPLAEFFTGYRQTALARGELIRAVRIPRPTPAFQRFYKVSKRVLDDISTVAGAFALTLDGAGHVARLGVGLGGVAAVPLAAPSLEAIARGRPWNEATLALLVAEAEGIGTPQSDHRGSAAYRRAMIGKLIERFFYESQTQSEAAQ
jgi:xanthine dehydrogenase small subunit